MFLWPFYPRRNVENDLSDGNSIVTDTSTATGLESVAAYFERVRDEY